MRNAPAQVQSAHCQKLRLSGKAIVLCCLIGMAWLPVMAQLTLEPMSTYPGGVSKSRDHQQARTQSEEPDPVSLPFWDDFSTQAAGVIPDTLLWVNSATVFISEGSAIEPPSINTAVFDGLDSVGEAYNISETTLRGYNDALTSADILLDEVASADRSSVYLSFFYQKGGYGEPPDDEDYLEVDFLDSDGEWQVVWQVYGSEVTDATTFNSAMIQVDDDSYFHEAFKFRIRNYGRQSGAYDTWIVDYIYLNSGRDGTSTSFPDRALASSFPPMFNGYYAMPYFHFQEDNTISDITFDAYNLRSTNGSASVAYNAYSRFTSYTDGVTATYSTKLVSEGAVGSGGLMAPLERVTQTLDALPSGSDENQFPSSADSVDVRLKIKLISGDSIDVSKDDFEPLDFAVNDTLIRTYTLSDYYAYDDGSAEYMAVLNTAGDQVAYKFEMPLDTAHLDGFYIYFPYLGSTSTESVDFYIYPDEDGVPGSTPFISLLSRTITKTGPNVFSYIQIVPAEYISGGAFYIAYERSTDSTVKIGVDRNNDNDDKTFYSNTSRTWTAVDIDGTLMIRPVITLDGGVVTAVEDDNAEEESWVVYPNPNQGTFYLPAGATPLFITDITGRQIAWEAYAENDERQRISLTVPQSGMYLVRWKNSQQLFMTKIVVQE